MNTIRRYKSLMEAETALTALRAAGIEAELADDKAATVAAFLTPWGIRLQRAALERLAQDVAGRLFPPAALGIVSWHGSCRSSVVSSQ